MLNQLIIRLISFSIFSTFFFNSLTFSQHIQNPYQNVNWKDYGRYKANLHTHTRLSDGHLNPETVIDEYYKRGYKILSITDHNRVSYPWTEFSKMQPIGRYKKYQQDLFKRGVTSSESFNFENRDPQSLCMIAVMGSEITQHNHMCSYFSDYDAKNPTHNLLGNEEVTLRENLNDGGLMIWNHPMDDLSRLKAFQLSEDTVGWYVDFYNRYSNLIGQEINNRNNDYILWDSTLLRMMPYRPVWGFSNDDMHDYKRLGMRYNIFLLPTLTSEAVKQGMIDGHFFFVYAPKVNSGSIPPNVDSITVSNKTITIYATNYDSIIWIAGGKVSDGDAINIDLLPESVNYVRAVIYGDEGSYLGTQPFGIFHPFNEISKGSGITDIDGNYYETIIIGNQEWMAENLRVTSYCDGTPLEYPGDDYSAWVNNKTGAYSWFNNDEKNYKEKYGALYNWFAVQNEAGICPCDWRVPTDEDWKELEVFLGMSEYKSDKAGWRGGSTKIAIKLTSRGSVSEHHPFYNLINSSGFNATLGGFRSTKWASFVNIDREGYWWTATPIKDMFAWTRSIEKNEYTINRFAFSKKHGFSIRCIKK